MHPDMAGFEIEITGDHVPEEVQQFLNDIQDESVRYIEAEARRLEIPLRAMDDIFYLRTRSRWTQEKENYLIDLAKNGKPLPNVGAGEF